VVVVIILIIGFAAGGMFWPTASAYLAQWHFQLPTGIGQQNQNTQSNNIDSIKPVYTPQTSQEEMVINAVKNYSSAVVSVIISKDVPTYERYYLSPNSGLTPFEQFLDLTLVRRFKFRNYAKTALSASRLALVQDSLFHRMA